MKIQTNIYDSNIYFALQFNDNTTLILEPKTYVIEPKNWSKMANDIPRDSQWYGFWTDFIEDKYGLTFTFIQGETLSGGGKYLQDIYEKYGDQAEVYFSIGYANQNKIPYKQIKSWRVNLQEYELDYGSDIYPSGGVMTSIEKMPFQGKLKARFSAPCTINQYNNMDGDLLTPIPTWTLRLHSKSLQEESLCKTQVPQTTSAYDNIVDSVCMSHDFILQPDQANVVVNELYNVFVEPTGIYPSKIDDGTSGTPELPTVGGLAVISGENSYLNSVSQYNPSTNGNLSVAWSGQAVIYTSMQGLGGLGPKIWYNIAPRIVQWRLVGGIWTLISVQAGTPMTLGNSFAGNPAPSAPLIATYPFDINGASQQYILPNIEATVHTVAELRGNVSGTAIVTRYDGFTWNENWNLVVQAGDMIFVHFVGLQSNSTSFGSDSDNINCGIQFDQLENSITYSQLTTVPGSTAPAYRAIDILNQMVENLTGQKNAVISPYFSKGGEGYKRLYTNGYGLRNYNSIINLPKKSLESYLGDLQATGCLYVGIRELEGIEYLVVDYITQGFKPLVIDTFLNTLEYKEKHNMKLCYNKFKFGFSTWQGLNLLMEDEFNTQADYLTQFLKYGDNLLQKYSDTIASGYILEEQRRNQFNLNPTQSITNDKDLFVVCTSEPSIFKQIFVTAYQDADNNPYLNFQISSLALMQGDIISLDIFSFEVLSESPGFPQIGQDQYYVVNQGNWVASTPYTVSALVFDTVDSSWYACKNNVTSTTPPHSDLANWKVWIFIDTYYDITLTPPSPDQIFAERSQPFEICTGVLDPSTIYNGRLSPKHILYAWAPIIAIGLYFVDPESQDYSASQIVTTEVKMNSKFTTKFLESEPFKGNAGTLTLCEFNRENISNFVGLQLFSPIEGQCKILGGWNQIEVIRKALCGETGNTLIDNGGLVLRDNKGEVWFHHVMTLKYDLTKQWIELDTQKVFRIS